MPHLRTLEKLLLGRHGDETRRVSAAMTSLWLRAACVAVRCGAVTLGSRRAEGAARVVCWRATAAVSLVPELGSTPL